MRAPARKRPQIRKFGAPPGADLAFAASMARYTGSPEHKMVPSFAGQPRPRANASMCDSSLIGKQLLLTRWLRQAIRQGMVSEFWEGRFPRYVWILKGGTVYEGRLVNREQGHYKGYPLEPDQRPEGMTDK